MIRKPLLHRCISTMRFNRAATLDNPTRRYTYIECLSNIRNVNGKPQQTTDADPRFIDYYGRPVGEELGKVFRGRLGQTR